jgi:trans-aconitate methyltransferase
MEWDARLYTNCHSFVSDYGRQLLDFVDAPQGRVLDLGCGTGDLTSELAKRCARVVGIDASAAMIETARLRYPELCFLVMDALQLDGIGKFDAVFSNAVFHWIAHQDALLTGIRHALHAGGRLVCEFGAKGNIGAIQKAYTDAAASLGKDYRSPFFFPSAEEYGALLRRHGFEVLHLLEYDRPTPLSGKEEGLRQWLRQFFAEDLKKYAPKEQERLFERVETALYGSLWVNSQWVADYRRLQAVAVRLPG